MTLLNKEFPTGATSKEMGKMTTIGQHIDADTGRLPDNSWVNWHENVRSNPRSYATPSSESEIQEIIRSARNAGQLVRTSGSGHSCTPLNVTDGVLVHLDRMRGLIDTDTERSEFTAFAGTQIFELGDPLWEAGLSLSNQGDIDVQTIAGAVATGTHGSGVELGSLSSAVKSVRLVNGLGEIVDIDDSQPELLRAAQVSMGMLGVMTRITMSASPAHYLQETVEYPPLEHVIADWDTYLAKYRHFSFWWAPDEESAQKLGISYPPGVVASQTAKLKLYSAVPATENVTVGGTRGHRLDRSYNIYPEHYEKTFLEMEYMIPIERGKEALGAVRRMIAQNFPNYSSVLEVRFIAGDDAYLSQSSGGPTMVIACGENPDEQKFEFMRAFEKTVVPFGGRPHWGKLHFLDRDQVHSLYPHYDDFVAVRRSFDPDGLFLNDHLRALFE